jgi:hypothetical protein
VKAYLMPAAAFCTGVAVSLTAIMYAIDGAGTADPAGSVGDFYAMALFWLVPLALAAWVVRHVVGLVLDLRDRRRPRAVVA